MANHVVVVNQSMCVLCYRYQNFRGLALLFSSKITAAFRVLIIALHGVPLLRVIKIKKRTLSFHNYSCVRSHGEKVLKSMEKHGP